MLQVRLDKHQGRVLELAKPGNVVVLPWGRGSGKTFLCCVLMLMFAVRKPNTKLCILMPTLKQCRRIFWPTLTELAGRRVLDDGTESSGLVDEVSKINNTDNTIVFRNGSSIICCGAENADIIRGHRFDIIFEDEADDIDPDMESAIVAPTMSKSGKRAIWFKTGTPRKGKSGILFRDLNRALNKEPGYFGFKLPSRESSHVDQRWLEEQRKNTLPAIFAREYECDFEAAEGLVFDMFKDTYHVRAPIVENPNDYTEIIGGMDWGYEDPTAIVIVGVAGKGDYAKLQVIEEVYQTKETPSYWVEVLKGLRAKYPRCRYWSDPSRPDFIEMMRNEAGVSMSRAEKHGSTRSIEDGCLSVADRLMIRQYDDGTDYARLFISPSCKNLIREIGLYRRRRDPQNTERILDTIEDKNNHAIDALRYAVFSRFGLPAAYRHVSGHGFER